MSNHIKNETSPYLQQHADNPVDWYPWGEEALTEAKLKNKPILLSIGYSACHWCHIMEKYCFKNEAIAKLMNDNFVNIKVDREERPDLDDIYMDAVQTMTGKAGWPLTVFLTPEGKPFYGGTYFPPESQYGIPGFPEVLRSLLHAYRTKPEEIEKTARRTIASLQSRFNTSTKREFQGYEILETAYQNLTDLFDSKNGGFGTEPKFPQPMTLEFLLRYSRHDKRSNAFTMVVSTLQKMSKGGVYDHIGGGFHRYSTDRYWNIPHFEKMLYDNALLSKLYIDAYIVTSYEEFRVVAEETLDYVLRDMSSEAGGFYCSQDADTEGMEGLYYLWTKDQIVNLLNKKDSKRITDNYCITDDGNYDGKNVFTRTTNFDPVNEQAIQQAKAKLFMHREERMKPARDEKILASWNGLMLRSLSYASCVFGYKEYLTAAVRLGDFLVNNMIKGGCLFHSLRDEIPSVPGFLQDYALVIDGLLALHQATFSIKYLEKAISLGEQMIEIFWDDENGSFFDTGKNHEKLIIRPITIHEGVIPSGSSAAVNSLLKLARLTGNTTYEEIGLQVIKSIQQLVQTYPLGFGNWLCALDFMLSLPKEIVIVGKRDKTDTRKMLDVLYKKWHPNTVFAARDPNDSAEIPAKLPIFKDKIMKNNHATVYICERFSCLLPCESVDELAKLLNKENDQI